MRLVYSFDFEALKDIRNHLHIFSEFMTKIDKDRHLPPICYLNFKISELKKEYTDENIERMPNTVYLRSELRNILQWMTVMLEELYEKYYVNKLLRKDIEVLQNIFYKSLKNGIIVASQFPFINSPICYQSSEEESD